jgi:succinate dehydrogenase / fumarate reductase cytochrome b subunit
MWSWVGHRITGVVIFFFLLVHVLDTSLVRVSPALGETGLVAAIVFHAFNGLRIIAVDFWKKGAKYQRQMLWAVLGLWLVTMVAFSIRHLSLALGGH